MFFHQEALKGKVVRAAARLDVLAARIKRAEAPPKGQEALASANFQNLKQTASDVAALRCELSSVRASLEASSQANLAFHQELLSALVSLFAFLLFFFTNFS